MLNNSSIIIIIALDKAFIQYKNNVYYNPLPTTVSNYFANSFPCVNNSPFVLHKLRRVCVHVNLPYICNDSAYAT